MLLLAVSFYGPSPSGLIQFVSSSSLKSSPFGFQEAFAERDSVEACAKIGIKWYRCRTDLKKVNEADRDFIVFLKSLGIEPVVMCSEMTASAWRSLLKNVADLVDWYEFRNEPNLTLKGEVGAEEKTGKIRASALQMARFMKEVAPIIRSMDRKAKIISAATAWIDFAYIKQMLENGAGRVVDFIGVHPYRIFYYPEAPQDPRGGWIEYDHSWDEYEALIELVKKYNPKLEVIDTEVGWPYFENVPENSHIVRAKYYPRTMLLEFYYGFKKIFLFSAKKEVVGLPIWKGGSYGIFIANDPSHDIKFEAERADVIEKPFKIVRTSEVASKKVVYAPYGSKGGRMVFKVKVPEDGFYYVMCMVKADANALKAIEKLPEGDPNKFISYFLDIDDGYYKDELTAVWPKWRYEPLWKKGVDKVFLKKGVHKFVFTAPHPGAYFDYFVVTPEKPYPLPPYFSIGHTISLLGESPKPWNTRVSLKNVDVPSDYWKPIWVAFKNGWGEKIVVWWSGIKSVPASPVGRIDLELPLTFKNPYLVNVVTGEYWKLSAGRVFKKLPFTDFPVALIDVVKSDRFSAERGGRVKLSYVRFEDLEKKIEFPVSRLEFLDTLEYGIQLWQANGEKQVVEFSETTEAAVGKKAIKITVKARPKTWANVLVSCMAPEDAEGITFYAKAAKKDVPVDFMLQLLKGGGWAVYRYRMFIKSGKWRRYYIPLNAFRFIVGSKGMPREDVTKYKELISFFGIDLCDMRPCVIYMDDIYWVVSEKRGGKYEGALSKFLEEAEIKVIDDFEHGLEGWGIYGDQNHCVFELSKDAFAGNYSLKITLKPYKNWGNLSKKVRLEEGATAICFWAKACGPPVKLSVAIFEEGPENTWAVFLHPVILVLPGGWRKYVLKLENFGYVIGKGLPQALDPRYVVRIGFDRTRNSSKTGQFLIDSIGWVMEE